MHSHLMAQANAYPQIYFGSKVPLNRVQSVAWHPKSGAVGFGTFAYMRQSHIESFRRNNDFATTVTLGTAQKSIHKYTYLYMWPVPFSRFKVEILIIYTIQFNNLIENVIDLNWFDIGLYR